MVDDRLNPENLKFDGFREEIFGALDPQETMRRGLAHKARVVGEKIGLFYKPTEIGEEQKALASNIADRMKLPPHEKEALLGSLNDRDVFNEKAMLLMQDAMKNTQDVELVPALRRLTDDVNEVAEHKEASKTVSNSTPNSTDDLQMAELEADYKDVEIPKTPEPNGSLPPEQQWKTLKTDLQTHNQQWTVDSYKNLRVDQLKAMEDVFVAQNINWMKSMIPEGYSPLPKENLDSLQSGILLQKYRDAKNNEGTSALTADQAQLLQGMQSVKDYIKVKEITPYGGSADDAYDAAYAAMNTLSTMETARMQIEGKTASPEKVTQASPAKMTPVFNEKASEEKPDNTPTAAFNNASTNQQIGWGGTFGSPHYTAVPKQENTQPQHTAASYLGVDMKK